MKLTRKTQVICVAVLLLCCIFLFLFYTQKGLILQAPFAWNTDDPNLMESLYLRFYCSRLAASSNPALEQAAAKELLKLAIYDLQTAHGVASKAIAQTSSPHPSDLFNRAHIQMRLFAFDGATLDFEEALKQRQVFQDLDHSPMMLSNDVEMAKACAAAKERYWHRKSRLATPPSRSASEDIPSNK